MKSFLLATALDLRIVTLTETLGDVEDRGLPPTLGTWENQLRNRSDPHRTVLDAYTRSDNWLAVLLWHVLPAWSLVRLDSAGIPTPGLGSPAEALGTGIGSPLELVRGYSALASHGVLLPTRFLRSEAYQGDSVRVWSTEAAVLMENAMRRVVDAGTARTAAVLHDGCGALAAKTGTVDSNLEFVMSGYHRTVDETITSIFWVGHDNPRTVVATTAGRLLGNAWRRATRAGTECEPRPDQA